MQTGHCEPTNRSCRIGLDQNQFQLIEIRAVVTANRRKCEVPRSGRKFRAYRKRIPGSPIFSRFKSKRLGSLAAINSSGADTRTSCSKTTGLATSIRITYHDFIFARYFGINRNLHHAQIACRKIHEGGSVKTSVIAFCSGIRNDSVFHLKHRRALSRKIRNEFNVSCRNNAHLRFACFDIGSTLSAPARKSPAFIRFSREGSRFTFSHLVAGEVCRDHTADGIADSYFVISHIRFDGRNFVRISTEAAHAVGGTHRNFRARSHAIERKTRRNHIRLILAVHENHPNAGIFVIGPDDFCTFLFDSRSIHLGGQLGRIPVVATFEHI